MNCRVVPLIILGRLGEMDSVTSVVAFTVSVVEADTPPDVTVIVVDPAATEVANPFDPAALLMVATPASEELHAAVLVRS